MYNFFGILSLDSIIGFHHWIPFYIDPLTRWVVTACWQGTVRGCQWTPSSSTQTLTRVAKCQICSTKISFYPQLKCLIFLLLATFFMNISLRSMTFCNPNFDPLTNEADLALVGLQQPVQFGKGVGLACLPREGAALQMRDALMV